MNENMRKCEDAVQHQFALTLPTPRPTHLQNKLKNQIFYPNATSLPNCQMSNGINARRHAQKLKSGKAKRNAKKKKYADAGFVKQLNPYGRLYPPTFF